MKVNQLDVTAVKPYENNPRKNTSAVDTVKKSIKAYGFQQPIVVDKNMEIIVGHTRYQAAIGLGLKKIPVVVADELSDEKARAYRIMDNRSGENAHWDDDLLFTELEKIVQDNDILSASDMSGFTEAELRKMFRTTDDILKEYDSEERIKSRPGDVWTMGKHKLLCGDSNSKSNLETLLGDEYVDMIWEDPPYGIAYMSANAVNYSKFEQELREQGKAIQNDDLDHEDFKELLTNHIQAIKPYWKKGGAIYWCHDIRFNHFTIEILTNHKVHVADTLIWKKQSMSNWISDYGKMYEPILYGWQPGAQHEFYGHKTRNTIDLDTVQDLTKEELIKIVQGFATNYQEVNRLNQTEYKKHPTIKPPKLIAYHITNSTQPGDIVYDGFSGSGSTLIAAEKTHRVARCIEMEPKYVDVAVQRWQELTEQSAIDEQGKTWNERDYV